ILTCLMTTPAQTFQTELERRHRKASTLVIVLFVLDIVLVAIVYFAAERLYRQGSPSTIMGLWIAILVFGLGAFVLRRTRFAALRLRDIAAVKGPAALLKTLQDTTIQCASIGGAIALMGFIITIRTGDWTDMLRATGVSVIVLLYCYPFRSEIGRAHV